MYHRIPLSIEVRKVLKLLMYTLFVLVFSISGYFFLGTSSSAERGYNLRENILRQKDLETENRLLKQRVIEAQSLTELKENALIKKLAEPDSIIFVPKKGPLSKRK